MRHKVIATIVLIAGIASAHSAGLGDNGATIGRQGRLQQELYGGVVVNQTVTVAGQDFYQYFVSYWRDKANSERYAVSVHERPSARWGSQVWVEFAQKRVFQASLPSARSNIQAVSVQAVEIAYQNVMDAEVQRVLFRDKDLAPDEM